MSDPPTDLVIDDLTVEFTKGDYTVRPLDHLSVTVKAGTLALLLGPSGCGKTTLLSCLAAILKPTSGSITFRRHGDHGVDRPAAHPAPAPRRRGRLPGVQPRAQPEQRRERRRPDALGRRARTRRQASKADRVC